MTKPSTKADFVRRVMARYSLADTQQLADRLGYDEAEVYAVWVVVRERKRAIRRLVERNLEAARG